MIEKIKSVLKKAEIAAYTINETRTESAECFFIRKNLDMKRRTDLAEYQVTVFHPFVKDEKPMMGSSSAQIYPEMDAAEIESVLRSAYYAASFVGNPVYELVTGEEREHIPSDSTLAGRGLFDNMKDMAEALFAADTEEEVFLNSAELFVRRLLKRIVGSGGVDVSYETCEVSGEYVVQCISPQDVETYHSFSYRNLDTENLRREVKEAMKMTIARAQAVRSPQAGEYRVLLSGEQMRTFLSYYLERSSSSMIYQEYSSYQSNMPVQGESIRGDALTILLKAREPYSQEGIPMKDRVLLENGVLRTIHGNNRFACYLGIEPTGIYDSILVPVGETPLCEMKKEPYLHIVSFSDFQMDSFSGSFGGEIRLAFLYDGETVTPVTGGSINGNILNVQEQMTFSKERYQNGRYEGPYAVSLKGVQVAGE